MKTKASLEIVDARAFEQTLYRMKDKYGYGLVSVDLDEQNEILEFTIHRYAMDGNGYHVGYEEFVSQFKLYSKSDFEVTEMSPYNLSNYFLFPHLLEIDVTPAIEEKEYSMDDAIQYLKDNYGYDDSDIANLEEEVMQEAYDKGMGEGNYFPPDEDFAWQCAIQPVIEEALANLISAEFDSETRTWTLGDYEYKVGE